MTHQYLARTDSLEMLIEFHGSLQKEVDAYFYEHGVFRNHLLQFKFSDSIYVLPSGEVRAQGKYVDHGPGAAISGHFLVQHIQTENRFPIAVMRLNQGYASVPEMMSVFAVFYQQVYLESVLAMRQSFSIN